MKPIMKTINILVPALVGTSMVAAPTSIAVYEMFHHIGVFDAQARQLKKEAIDEFINICSVPHPTFGTKQICEYLKTELSSIGYRPATKIEDVSEGLHFFEDNYVPEKIVYPGQHSGNLIFEIPATKGREQSPGIVLQAHMDMVLDGFEEGQELVQCVEPVIENNTIHSKDFKTSLGADDGAGLALILALAKHPDIVPHGPLRCIITADEEDGISGAKFITYKALKYDYVLNLDGEELNGLTISAAGTTDQLFHVDKIKKWEQGKHEDGFVVDADMTQTEYQLVVEGLHGGHSASEINNGRASAIELAVDSALAIETVTPQPGAEGGVFQLVSMEADNLSNQISPKATINFVCSLPLESVGEEASIEGVLEYKRGKYAEFYPKETELSVKCEQVANRADKALNLKGSDNCLSVIDTLPFGPISWLDKDRKEVQTSANLSKLVLDLTRTGDEESGPQFQIESLLRSSSQTYLNVLTGYYKQQGLEYLNEMVDGTQPSTVDELSKTPSWEPIIDEKFQSFVTKAMKDANISHIQKINNHGWLEVGFFWEKYVEQEIIPHIVSIGPTIKNCHSKQETFYLNTYQPFIQSVLYIISLIDEVK
ncbi:MAG: M20/M25/M40 family metallo-hydrolase [Mycoplasmoidaceae bacterium]